MKQNLKILIGCFLLAASGAWAQTTTSAPAAGVGSSTPANTNNTFSSGTGATGSSTPTNPMTLQPTRDAKGMNPQGTNASKTLSNQKNTRSQSQLPCASGDMNCTDQSNRNLQ